MYFILFNVQLRFLYVINGDNCYCFVQFTCTILKQFAATSSFINRLKI